MIPTAFFSSPLPISAHIILWLWLYIKEILRQVVLPFFPSFIWTCTRRIQPAAQNELCIRRAKKSLHKLQLSNIPRSHKHTGHVHKRKQSKTSLVVHLFFLLAISAISFMYVKKLKSRLPLVTFSLFFKALCWRTEGWRAIIHQTWSF